MKVFTIDIIKSTNLVLYMNLIIALLIADKIELVEYKLECEIMLRVVEKVV
jgi:hypothetical protein